MSASGKLTSDASKNDIPKKGTVVTGVIGDDVHVIGIRLMEYALRQSGFQVASLGPLAQPKEFIDAAIETAADALFISSLNGHAELYLPGLRGACMEAGIGDILIYAGGQLTIRRPDWTEVERRFVNEIGMSRVYPSDVSPDVPIRDLEQDIAARRAAKRASKEA
jgi:methylaspartate mutase sigma subunit